MSRRGQAGMTLIEVMVTILVLSAGTLATLASFTGFSRAATSSQTRAVLVSLAQQQIEALRPTPYAQLGLASSPTSQAAAEAPRTGLSATEPLVTGGVVAPGGDAFTVQGVSGRIYRYVTSRTQACPALTTAVQGQLATLLNTTLGSVASLLPDLCPTTATSKRITIAVVPLDRHGKPGTPVRLSTVATDPSSSVPVLSSVGLKLQPVVQALTGTSGAAAPVPTTTQQAFQLTDTRCDQSSRATPGDHAAHSTSLAGAICSGGIAGRPDLMTLSAIPGQVTDTLDDYSTDVTRAAAGGLVLMRDDRAGNCTDATSTTYSSAEATTRRYSVHTWATPASTAAFHTASTGGRGVLSIWTRTADTGVHPGRLCVVVRQMSTGTVLGSADFSLTRWPTDPSELAIAFDLQSASLPVGERLLVTLRTPKDSGADIQLLYDHPAYQSRLTLTTDVGKEFK